MRHRSPARFLAPLALVVCAVAVYAVVQDATSSDGGNSETGTTSTAKKTSTGTRTGTTKRKAPAKPKTYTVQPGDVLSAIAERNGVTIVELQAANPDVDASALRPGQKLKLPR